MDALRHEWLLITGWGGMLTLSFLPYTLLVMFVYAMAVSKISLVFFRVPDYYYSLLKIASRVAIIAFAMFTLQYIITHIFESAARLRSVAFNHLPGWVNSISVYSHMGLLIATIGGLFICISISYRLNMKFTSLCVLKHPKKKTSKQKKR